MIKTISYWALPDGLANTCTIERALALTKSTGFAGLELAISSAGAITIDLAKAECSKIRKMIDASGVVVQTLANGMSWGTNPISNDAATRKKSVAQTGKALERAGWLGCDAMLYVPGVVGCPWSPDEHVRYDHALARTTENVKRLLDVADKAKVDLCIENVWNGFFYSPVELAQFIDSFDHPRLGVYFDVGNVLGYHQWPPHWIELLGKRIKRVHVKDFKQTFGGVGCYSFCDLGAGSVPWAASIKALRDIGYDKTVVAELMPFDDSLLQRTSAAMDVILASHKGK